MILRRYIKESTRSLLAAKQRTALALIGIVIGVGAVIAMVSVGQIVQNEAVQQFKDLGTDIINVENDMSGLIPVEKTQSLISGSVGYRSPNAAFRLIELMSIPKKCPAIMLVSPTAPINSGEFTYAGKKLERTFVMGVTESFWEINRLKLKSGRFLSDLDEQSQFCVVGSEISAAIRNQGINNLLGEKIRVGDAIFIISGVIEEMPVGGTRRFDPNVSVFVHITTGMRMFKDSEITAITAKVAHGVDNDVARGQLIRYFTAQTGNPAVRLTSPEDLIAQMQKQMRMFTFLLGAIGGISLIVGGVGVMNVMLVAVSEQRREIGIRRALGARRSDIMGQFIVESVILTMIGGLFGIIIGVAASRIISHFANWHFILPINSIILGVSVSTVVGLFFGVYPARQASMVDPVVALRYE